MVTVPKEKSFPRGGRVERTDAPRRKIPDWCKNKFSVGLHKKKGVQIKQKTSKSKSAQSAYEEDEIAIKDKKNTQNQNFNTIRPYTGPLKYNAIAEGMLILGSIYKIESYKLGISLPGNCIGYVPITNISEPYRQALSSLVNNNNSSDIHYLRDMFHIGQYVVTKVVKREICDDVDTNKIVLSLSPQDIHSDCSNKDIRPQSVFTAAVSSIEEKVYVMDLGIKSVRAVLKKANADTFKKVWNEDKELGIGQLVRCVVLNVTTEKQMSIVTLSADPYLVAKASCSKIGSTLRGFLPGMLFDVTVARHLFPSGIQVRLSENIMGYVPQNHFPRTFRNPEDFQVGSVHPARVLYISKSGAIFFTMKKNVCLAQPPVSPFKALKAGCVAKNAVIWNVSETGLTVKLTKSENVSFKGYIPVSHILDHKYGAQDSDLPLSAQLANEFPIGSEVACRIMDYCYMDQYYLCTMKKTLMKEAYLHPSSLKVGVVVSCIIKEMNPKGITVMLGKHSPVSGFVHKLHTCDVPLAHPQKKFNINQACTARVLRLDNCIHLTMKHSLIQSTNILTTYDSAEVGKKYLGTVVHRSPTGILVEFFSNVTGWVSRSFLSKKPLDPSDVETTFYLGQVICCTVIGKSNTPQKLTLSLVDTEVLSDAILINSVNVESTNKEMNVQSNENSDGEKICVEVKSKNDKTKYEQAEGSVNSNCQKQDKLLSKKSKKKSQDNIDSFEDDGMPKKKQKLIAVKSQEGEVQSNITVKKSKKTNEAYKIGSDDRNNISVSSEIVETGIKGKLNAKKSKKTDIIPIDVSEIKKKRKLTIGPVDEVTDSVISTTKKSKKPKKNKSMASAIQNIDVNLEISSEVENDSRLKKKKEGNAVNDPSKIQGTKVQLKTNSCHEQDSKSNIHILSYEKSKKGIKNREKKVKKVNSSDESDTRLVPFDEGYITSDMSVAVTTDETSTQKKRKSLENRHKKADMESKENKKTKMEAMGTDPAEEAEKGVANKPVELPSLSLKTGFVWDATPNSRPAVTKTSSDENSSDDDDDDNRNKKVKRSRQAIIAEKRHQAQLEEARLRSIEQRLMDPEQLPQTADEFDRLVLASPDNSMVWLQYMAYHIQATEVDKARNVATRALKTISFREEQEKLNVWMALLNLENLYGTNESMKNSLEEAVRLNDPYKVYTQMLQIYADSHKLTEGDELITAMVKKFKTVKDMWINLATFYMKSGQMVKARALLQRALNNLEKKEHVSVISQFALLENNLGSKERAQTLMEQILTSYPKRVDVWSVYVDMLVKSSLISIARQVLERGVAQRLQSHKMKALFKKFLAFEEAHGTEESADRVRQLALEYVEAATATNTE